jgi:hypothetical protein
MSSKFQLSPQVEGIETRVLLSGFGRAQRKFVDVTGEFMRHDAWSPPKSTGRAGLVYDFNGSGGVSTLGAVQTSGTITDSGRNGTHSYRGNITLANNQGSVKLTIRANTYKITGGTGVYRGATGLGAVSFGTGFNDTLAGISLTGDL